MPKKPAKAKAKIINQEYELVPTGRLKPHPRNVNRGDLAVIAESIAQNGFYGAVVAQRSTGYILAGNHRHEAAVAAGIAAVPTTWVDVDDDRALRILLADNRSTRAGHDDQEALAALLQEILGTSETLEGTGYSGEDLDALLQVLDQEPTVQVLAPVEGLTDEDAVPELRPDPVTVPGDIWLLGDHRLMCGDSTSVDAVERLMAGEKADMVFTDPPYGISFQSGMSKGGTATRFDTLENDDKILDVAPVVLLNMKADSAAFVWTSQRVYPEWREQFSATYKSTIIWHKPGGGIGDLYGDYAADYEMCLFCVNGRPMFRGKRGMAVWTVGKDRVNDYQHPTQKPVELAERAVGDFSDAGETVLDLFGGSGSTLIACEKTRRKSRLMEIDPRYCDVIINRWQEFTGREALLEGDGRSFAAIKSERFLVKLGAQDEIKEEILA